mgnify:CR=1 FL=1
MPSNACGGISQELFDVSDGTEQALNADLMSYTIDATAFSGTLTIVTSDAAKLNDLIGEYTLRLKV